MAASQATARSATLREDEVAVKAEAGPAAAATPSLGVTSPFPRSRARPSGLGQAASATAPATKLLRGAEGATVVPFAEVEGQ